MTRMDRRTTILAACAALLAPGLGLAQAASVSGTVTDRTTGHPIVGARIIVLGDSRSALTDSLGRYELRGMPAGTSQITVVVAPYPALSFVVALGELERFVRPVVLDSSAAGRAAQELPPVGVSAPARVANYRLVGFERRRTTGRGQYLTETQIVESGAFNLPDAVKGMRGVTYECGGGRGCFVRMSRAPARCLPEYIVDDQVLNDFGPSTPIRDIIAIELYTGPTEVPAEYAGRNAGCGVIVLWTRSGPARRPPR